MVLFKSGWRRRPWVVVAAVAAVLVGLPTLAMGWLIVAAFLPLDVESVSAEHPARAVVKRAERGGAPVWSRPSALVGYEEREVSFPSRLPDKGLAQLRGVLTVPEGQGRRPAVLLIGGSGPTNRDSATPGDILVKFDAPFLLFQHVSRWLGERGFVVLRYDKRCCLPCYKDVGSIDPTALVFEDFIDDAKDGVEFLAARPEVDPRAIFVVGHSEGGHFAPFVAEGDERVAGVVMLAGNVTTFERVLLDQFDALAELRLGVGDVQTAAAVKVQRERYAGCFARLEGAEYDPREVCIGGGVTQEALKAYLALSRRLPAVMEAQEAPLLYILGSADRNVGPQEFELAVELSGRMKDVELHYIEGVTHPLTALQDAGQPKGVAPRVLEVLERFLGSVRR
jgi:dienelactone hydrolase